MTHLCASMPLCAYLELSAITRETGRNHIWTVIASLSLCPLYDGKLFEGERLQVIYKVNPRNKPDGEKAGWDEKKKGGSNVRIQWKSASFEGWGWKHAPSVLLPFLNPRGNSLSVAETLPSVVGPAVLSRPIHIKEHQLLPTDTMLSPTSHFVSSWIDLWFCFVSFSEASGTRKVQSASLLSAQDYYKTWCLAHHGINLCNKSLHCAKALELGRKKDICFSSGNWESSSVLHVSPLVFMKPWTVNRYLVSLHFSRKTVGVK